MNVESGTALELSIASLVDKRLKSHIDRCDTLYYTFEPRPDDVFEYDEQTSFVNSKSRFSICLGGTGCIAGESTIYDPVANKHFEVGSLKSDFHVVSWSRGLAIARANRPFRKGVEDLYRVVLDDGSEFKATLHHRVLCEDGVWRKLCELLPRFDAFRLLSIPGSYLSAFRQDASRWFRRQRDCRDCYSTGLRRYGGQPRYPSSTFLGSFRQRAGVLERTLPSSPLGDGETRSARSQICHESYRLSKQDFSDLGLPPRDAYGTRASSSLSKPTSPRASIDLRSNPTFELSRLRINHRSHTNVSWIQPASRFCCGLPSFRSPKLELGGIVPQYRRIVAVEFLRRDEYFDFTVPGTHNYVMNGVVHHNSGKTIAAAYKTAKYVLETPAPRPLTPFWIVGVTYDLVCQVCWQEKLSNFIPKSCIKSIDWYREKRGWPFAVILHDLHGTGTNWVLDHKSYAQGRERMQAVSLGGYWCNEQVPLEIVQEVHGRCRDYDSPGWADFTPLSMDAREWADMYDLVQAGSPEAPPGWEFFHLNTERNHYLAEGWAERFLKSIPEDLRAVRGKGMFASFAGQVFKEFDRKIHIIEPFEIPSDWKRIRGIDFGYTNPFVCVWVAKDNDGRYYVYDEHYAPGQLIEWHARAIARKQPWRKHPSYTQTYADSEDAQSRAELVSKRLQDQGIAISTVGARKDLLPGIEALRKLMIPAGDGKPRFFIFNTCKETISEFRDYHWALPIGKDLRKRDPRIDAPVPYRDHTIDAVRYAIFSDLLACHYIPDPIDPLEKEWVSRAKRGYLVGSD